MEQIKGKVKVSFGPISGLLVASVAYAILIDASLRYDKYKEYKKLVKLGESVKSLGEKLMDVKKEHEKEGTRRRKRI